VRFKNWGITPCRRREAFLPKKLGRFFFNGRVPLDFVDDEFENYRW
jgi:hypothetical protein